MAVGVFRVPFLVLRAVTSRDVLLIEVLLLDEMQACGGEAGYLTDLLSNIADTRLLQSQTAM